MKPRFFILIFALIFIIIVAIAASSKPNNNSAMQQRPDPTLKFTVQSDTIGNDYIIITNEATGSRVTVTQNMLPFSANFAKGDVLTFKVAPRDGYIFNTWIINDGTWESGNPLSIRPTGDFTMKAYFLPIG
ncbi:hypothetical protein M0R36_11380 [bacterium]|nr:hypothetical protein [bacterium]